MSRWSVVGFVDVFNLSEASILQAGDNRSINSASKVMTVVRQVPTYLGNEGNFTKYPVYSRPIPLPASGDSLSMKVNNDCSVIKVRSVRIIGIAGSSVFQAGRNEIIESEARVKEFRQFITRARPKATKEEAQPDNDTLE
ncbi:spore germination protein GerPE [Paenibacillus sp. OAS669]|uniref:spore germination protein GerPE n=1 Tax=Paenibacillus sp. OAS669 TaxID=2663821 RepID=UPI00178B9486|nr:spore germination protein GerPE [Paenibacillus sp. OAS669]